MSSGCLCCYWRRVFYYSVRHICCAASHYIRRVERKNVRPWEEKHTLHRITLKLLHIFRRERVATDTRCRGSITVINLPVPRWDSPCLRCHFWNKLYTHKSRRAIIKYGIWWRWDIIVMKPTDREFTQVSNKPWHHHKTWWSHTANPAELNISTKAANKNEILIS